MEKNSACEVWKVEEQKIMIKHNFSNSGAIILENVHNLNPTCKTLTNYLNLKIKHTMLLQLGVSQFSLNIGYIPFIYFGL
jgi:hypothetical protein